MSNIHGIDSAPLNPPPNDGFQGRRGEVPNFLRSWVDSSSRRPEPRKETFFQMLKFMFCPNISMRSFTAIITMVDVCFFVVCFFGSLVEYKGLNPHAFLGPNDRLYDNFEKDPSKIAKG